MAKNKFIRMLVEHQEAEAKDTVAAAQVDQEKLNDTIATASAVSMTRASSVF